MTKSRILVVDDDAVIRLISQHLLEANGFEVRAAADGPQSLRLIPTFRPHLVLLDVMMPIVNGYRVSRMIKTLVRHAGLRVPKVVLLTARRVNSERLRDLLEFSKADQMLFKPYNQVTLIRTIEYLLVHQSAHPTAE